MRIIFSLTFLLLNGCASIVAHDFTSVDVLTSNSEKANVTVDGVNSTVPGVILLKNDGKKKVILSESEQCAQSTEVDKKIEPLFFGNAIFGGLLGSSIDAISGKMWRYEDSVVIKCENKESDKV